MIDLSSSTLVQQETDHLTSVNDATTSDADNRVDSTVARYHFACTVPSLIWNLLFHVRERTGMVRRS